MFKDLRIENFRGFSEIEFTNLNRLNLLTGKNNVGKSSLLEAVFLLCAHVMPQAINRVQIFRGVPSFISGTYGWTLLFNQYCAEKAIQIAGHDGDAEFSLTYAKDNTFVPGPEELGHLQGEFARQYVEFAQREYCLKFTYSYADYREDGYFFMNGQGGIGKKLVTSQTANPVHTTPDALYVNSNIVTNSGEALNWLGVLQREDKISELVKIAQIIEPDLTDILPVVTDGVTLIHGRIRGKLLPLKDAGSGLNQILYIIMGIMTNPRSVLLLDEIENGFHYLVYLQLWEVLAILADRYGTQIIATTHSYECLKGANSGVKRAGKEEFLTYYRMDRMGDKNKAYRLDSSEFDFALEHEMEIR